MSLRSYVWLHALVSQDHLQATHFDQTYCTVFAYVNGTHWHTSSLFLIFVLWECLFFFCLCIAASLCPLVCAASLVVCTLYWFGVPYTEPQYDDRKRTDILKMQKLRLMMTYINKYHWHKWAQCISFHQNVLPEDGSVKPKYVARHRILMTF
jgi:hypothetical protein